MPIYEYKCSACGHKFEELQDMKAVKTFVCPKCKGIAERMLSAATPISSHGCAGHGHCGVKEGGEMLPCASGCAGGKCRGF